MNARASNGAVIVARNVAKTFGVGRAAVPALRGIDLAVRDGELLMLVGPSGCGKTTLISILAGVLMPDEGEVDVLGVSWSRLPPSERTARRGRLVGFVFQQFNLVPTISAVENVAVPLLIRGWKWAAALQRAADILSDFGLGDRLQAPPAELSGGMQQRVAIARALVAQPHLLVCDEPTANLDGPTGQHVMELIRSATRAGGEDGHRRSVVVVTHDPRILHFADRILQMEDGLLRGETAVPPPVAEP